MSEDAIAEIIERFETPALEIQSASIPVNPAGTEVPVSRDQLSQALRIWGRGDARFVPSFVESTIVEDSGDQIVKDILHYGKSSMADGSPNLQRTSFRGENLMITEYLAGPWFMAIAGHRHCGREAMQLAATQFTQVRILSVSPTSLYSSIWLEPPVWDRMMEVQILLERPNNCERSRINWAS